MEKNPMTVKDLREALAKQPDSAFVSWVDSDGSTGYFYADEQQMDVDDGHVHLSLGSCR